MVKSFLWVGAVMVFFGSSLFALEPWRAALAQMPLKTNVTELTKTNCIPLMLASLQENETVKGLIFMPGSTDEFYFFNRGYAQIEMPQPSLLDAVTALESQTAMHATFRKPFLLIHSAEDPLDAVFKIEHEPTAERVRKKKFAPHTVVFDQDWDSLVPTLSFYADTKFLPPKGSMDSWHFYRHSFAGWNLSAWETLEAASLAGKTIFTVQKKKIVFEGDKRFRSRPAVPSQP